MIKNIIFDWSGVVNDNILATCSAINFIFAKHGVPSMTVAEVKENWIQPYMLFYEKIIPGLNLEEEKELFYLGYAEAVKINPPTAFAGSEPRFPGSDPRFPGSEPHFPGADPRVPPTEVAPPANVEAAAKQPNAVAFEAPQIAIKLSLDWITFKKGK